MIKYFVIMIFLIIFYITSYNYDCNKKEIIKTLARQAARWSTAAEQDNNPYIALLHANYGAGYLWALKDIATDNEIEEVLNIDVLKFRDDITTIQDNVSRRILSLYHQLAPRKTSLTKIAGEE